MSGPYQLPPVVPNFTFPQSGNQKLNERVKEIMRRVPVPKEVDESLRRLRIPPDPGGRLQEWLDTAFEVIWRPLRPRYYLWIIKAFLRKTETPADLVAPEWLWKARSPEGLPAYKDRRTSRDRPTATKELREYFVGDVEMRLRGGRQVAFEKAYLAIRSKSPFVAETKSTTGLHLDEAMSSGRHESKTKQPKAVERGQICVQLKNEMKRVRYMTREGGKSINEIKSDTPNFFIWKVAESEELSKDDREMVLHPNQWETGYPALLLSKYFGVSTSRIRDYITKYNRTTKTPRVN